MNKLIFYILILLIQSCVFVKGKTDVIITLKNLSNPKNSNSICIYTIQTLLLKRFLFTCKHPFIHSINQSIIENIYIYIYILFLPKYCLNFS